MINRKAMLQRRFANGFNKTEVNYPLAIENVIERKAQNYKVYGNSTQKTRSSKNLFNIDYFSDYTNYDGVNVYRYKATNLPKKILYVKCELVGTAETGLYMCISNKQQPNIAGASNKFIIGNGQPSADGTLDCTNFDSIYISYYPSTGNASDLITHLKDNYRIMISTDNVSWEPYIDTTQELRSRKNMLNTNTFTTVTANGITITHQSDGGVKFVGTSTDRAGVVFFGSWNNSTPRLNLDANKSYTVTVYGAIKGTNVPLGIDVRGLKNGVITKVLYGTDEENTKTITGFSSLTYCTAYTLAGNTLNNTLYIQIEEGTQSTDYEPYGAIPSPDIPTDIISLGDKTDNVFNINAPSVYYQTSNNYEVNAEQVKIKITGDSYPLWKMKFKPNTTYTIKNLCSVSEGGLQWRVRGFTSNVTLTNGWSSFPTGTEPTWTLNTYNTVDDIHFTTSNNAVCWYFGFYAPQPNTEITVSEIMIYEGTQQKQYEHYGYKLQYESNSKNMLNANGTTLTSNGIISVTNNNTTTCNGTTTTSWFDIQNDSNKIQIDLKANQTYTLSIKNPILYRLRMCIYKDNGTTNLYACTINPGSTSASFTPVNDITHIRFYIDNGISSGTTLTNYKIENIMIEKGTTAHNYVPYFNDTATLYLNEPLRAIKSTSSNYNLQVGDNYYVADYLDYERQKVVRKIGKVVLDGSETNLLENIATRGLFQITLSNITTDYINIVTMSNYFKSVSKNYIDANLSTTTEDLVSIYSGNRIFIVYKDYANNLNGFKTWLSTNNVKVVYALATPVEEDIVLPSLGIAKETTIITADTEVKPLAIEIDYSSKEV